MQSWLHGHGLASTWDSEFAINVSATAGQVSAAFATSFERYDTRTGHEGYLAQQTPLVPQQLAGGQIAAILGLNTVTTFQPQLAQRKSLAPKVARGPGATGQQPGIQANTSSETACSAAQSSAGSSYYTLTNLGADYGVGSLLDNGQTGHGQPIGLYELASSSGSDISTYKSCWPHPVTQVRKTVTPIVGHQPPLRSTFPPPPSG